ncbi:hypothetical protein NSX50_24640, partial [Salmonella enterica]|nr:hypothetical protein [Salmonella enterica]
GLFVSTSDFSLALLPSSPIAEKQAYTLNTHDKTRIDNYYWMRDDERQNKDVLAHLHAENSYCEAQLAPMQPLQNILFEELKGR